ncbi:MAG TPA: spermidine/putrescine ABC transporter substrate-binding protein [Epulopiscium sp.]|nr:spermidine/putrescine ABC transporter substrate-binding protein [Candidatus Epulonipiscium sp.]
MNQRIKKIALAIMIGTMALGIVGCGEKKESINVYNWGDYIDESVNTQFTKETGIKVNYKTFATNEDMYVDLAAGGSTYDVAFPSDYMIEKMIKNDLAEKIDMTNVPNYSNVDHRFIGMQYDPTNEYSIPYMWGTVGIIYNKSIVTGPVDSWDILWDSAYEKQILMMDSQRDSIMVALKKLGYDMNTRDEAELEKAKAELITQKPLVLAYVGDEGKDKIINEEAAMMVAWSGDAVYMMRENENLEYVVPKEGSNYWVDGMVIPKGAKNKAGAEKYIDFLCRADISAMNAEYIGYSTPIEEARKLLPAEDANSEVAYPSEEITDALEVFTDPSDVVKIYDRIWTEVKATR